MTENKEGYWKFFSDARICFDVRNSDVETNFDVKATLARPITSPADLTLKILYFDVPENRRRPHAQSNPPGLTTDEISR